MISEGLRAPQVVPYTLDANDMRFVTASGFSNGALPSPCVALRLHARMPLLGEQFFTYLKDAFDYLYKEGAEGAPRMMSIGLHCRHGTGALALSLHLEDGVCACRLVARPGRAAALERFLDYVKSKTHAWVCTRLDIARHWIAHFPPKEHAVSKHARLARARG